MIIDHAEEFPFEFKIKYHLRLTEDEGKTQNLLNMNHEVFIAKRSIQSRAQAILH